ncbi:MAG: type II toxin-antitoxin system HicB family antitoxin [Polyangiaceae bacterium]|nr:type II toxin-antitoxin system HicB family antitoxin [Polyangiaceae bacterium]
MKYLVVVEKTSTGFSAYSPDLPGCVAAAATREQLEAEMAAAISFHIDGLRTEGMTVPQPQSASVYLDVPT